MFSRKVDVSRRALKLHSILSSLKKLKFPSCHLDNLREFNNLPAKAEYPCYLDVIIPYLDVPPLCWCYQYNSGFSGNSISSADCLYHQVSCVCRFYLSLL